jgi:VanZ family protein
VLFGGGIEIAQGFTGRDASLWDLAADTAGVLAALAPFLVARLVRARP